jgi:galactose mutarotase-like enzyme
MYVTQLTEWLRQLWKQVVLRSGVVTIGILAVLVVGLALGWRAHRRGRFARLKAEIRQRDQPHTVPVPRPGGQDPVVLERSPIEAGSVPEFLSATLLPGRGMNVLQITAMLPNKHRVSLLDSPSIGEAETRMTGTGDDALGEASLGLGGAFEAPWAGRLYGSMADDHMTARWNGSVLQIPAKREQDLAIADGGLLLAQSGTSIKSNVMPDGGEAEALYQVNDSGDAWPSRMSVKTTVQLSGRALEIRIVAKNTGDKPEPVGIGWRPRFSLLSRDRGKVRLRLPSVMREELRSKPLGMPTGKLVSSEGTVKDFSATAGKELGGETLDDTFVNLRQAPLDSGPVAELWDPENNFGIRITMLSASIKAIHVSAPADGRFVTLDPRFNYDDPLGEEWPKDDKAGMITLKPGDSTQWRIRLEIYGSNSATATHF